MIENTDEIKGDLNKWKYILCPWILRLNIVKMSVLPSLTHSLKGILIKISTSYFVDINKLFQSLCGKEKVYMESWHNTKEQHWTVLRQYKAIGWDGWIASLIQWTWTWADSRRWWGTGRPGVLQATGSQRVGHDLATEQQTYRNWIVWTFHRIDFLGWNYYI